MQWLQRTDQKHWLTFGTIDVLPILYGNYPILMTSDNAQAAVRIGELINDPTQKKMHVL